MRLLIAEKPSLARAIAAAIPGQHRRSAHHIECSTGDVVAWCAGHVLEMAPPEDYAEELRTWTLDTLPIVPASWKHRVAARELVDALRRLVAKASRVVHAGDPDREGQLLVDEVLLHLGWNGPTERLLITDLSPAAVRRALAALEPNQRYRPLYEAALGRQRADWLFGLNLTRLYTLRARQTGYRGVVSVGRVQTPVLGIVVRRDREIEQFVAKAHYSAEATLRSSQGVDFTAVWAVGKEHAQLLDADGRLLDRHLAASVAAKVAGQIGTVTCHEQAPHAERAPRAYSLATLQIDAGRQLGLSAARVLEIAQRLYERQLLTYPRSDCEYLPEAHFEQAHEVISAVCAVAPELAPFCAVADFERRGPAWNDAKVSAHHAIIPTAQRSVGQLESTERAVYALVARRYVQQLLPAFEYLATRVEVVIAGELFVARGRRIVAPGWKVAEATPPALEELDEAASDERCHLPPLVVGECVSCPSARVLDKQTKPPRAFTDATLIQAMCTVAKLVTDPQAKKILQETDGIGTPATRATIIETLLARGFIERRKKQIRATVVGRALIDALPAVATTPDRTALWEAGLRRINERQLGLDRFLAVVASELGELVAWGKASGNLTLPEPVAARPRRRSSGRGQGRQQRPSRAAPAGSESPRRPVP